jgi:hypothetical protein
VQIAAVARVLRFVTEPASNGVQSVTKAPSVRARLVAPTRRNEMTSGGPPEDSLKRRANELMRNVLANDAELPLFCECDDPLCLRTVWLTRAEYDQARSDPDWRPLSGLHAKPPVGRAGRTAAVVPAAARRAQF